jgi:hypothetical protein
MPAIAGNCLTTTLTMVGVTGSIPVAPTTQSRATGDFLKVCERPRTGGDVCDGSF